MRKDFRINLKRTTGILLLLALSAVFLFSAGTKLYAIEPFEWTFIDLLPVGFTAASLVARLFIGLELCIGLFLLAHVHLRPFTYKASLALLLLLTGYLSLLLLKQGNNGNCGCFGETYQMKPLAAIGKNIGMIAAIGILRVIYPGAAYKRQNIAGIAATIIAFALPFALSPVYLSGNGKVVKEPVSLNAVYESGTPKPGIDLRQGKHIVVFLSLTCPHCRKAAYLIQMLHHKYPDLPFFMVLNGRREREASFFGETKSREVPNSIMRDVPAFTAMAGDFVPAIYWISNSVIERKTYYTELEPKAIRAWMEAK